MTFSRRSAEVTSHIMLHERVEWSQVRVPTTARSEPHKSPGPRPPGDLAEGEPHRSPAPSHDPPHRRGRRRTDREQRTATARYCPGNG
jgi:hypothetical protein